VSKENLLQKIMENFDAVIGRDSPLAESLWEELLALHPADIADFIEDLDKESGLRLFGDLPKGTRNEVFSRLPDGFKVDALSVLDDSQRVEVLRHLSIDELTDLFDYFSDEELKKYLNLLHKKERQKVLSLLKFHPESAGGIMEIDVLSFLDDFTVEKSVKLMQRMRPKQEIHSEIYVTDKDHKLIGHIHLEDLVFHSPETKISSFMQKNELVAQADEDREDIAKKMVHYGLMTVPVVGKDSYFLGIIPTETLVDVIVKESSEDVQRMSALPPMKRTYMDSSLMSIIYKRSPILVTLLIVESLSATVMHSYEGSIPLVMTFFVATLVNAGGGASHQTSTLVIQGLSTGEIHKSNILKFLRKEFLVAGALALILGVTGFARAYFVTKNVMQSFVVGLALGAISVLGIALGSFVPLVLRKMKIDPAFSAGPFLATVVDILGILIYCVMIKMILS